MPPSAVHIHACSRSGGGPHSPILSELSAAHIGRDDWWGCIWLDPGKSQKHNSDSVLEIFNSTQTCFIATNTFEQKDWTIV